MGGARDYGLSRGKPRALSMPRDRDQNRPDVAGDEGAPKVLRVDGQVRELLDLVIVLDGIVLPALLVTSTFNYVRAER